MYAVTTLAVLLCAVALATCTKPAKKLTEADLKKEFNAADKDHDGKINKAEAEAIGRNHNLPKAESDKKFTAADTDHDGKITYKEFIAAAKSFGITL